jgi:hypothetical protein
MKSIAKLISNYEEFTYADSYRVVPTLLNVSPGLIEKNKKLRKLYTVNLWNLIYDFTRDRIQILAGPVHKRR